MLRTEHANLRAALSWLVATDGQDDRALRLAGSLGLYWHLGRHLEGREVLRRVMALPGGSPHSRARACRPCRWSSVPARASCTPARSAPPPRGKACTSSRRSGTAPGPRSPSCCWPWKASAAAPAPTPTRLLQHADDEFAALGDDWGRAVAAFVRMETSPTAAIEAASGPRPRTPSARFRALDDGWGLSAVLYHFGWALSPVRSHGRRRPGAAGSDRRRRRGRRLQHRAMGHRRPRPRPAGAGPGGRGGRLLRPRRRGSDQVGDDAGQGTGDVRRRLDGGRARAITPGRDRCSRRACGAFEALGVSLATGLALAGVADCDARLGRPDLAAAGYARLLALAETNGEASLLCLALEGSAGAVVDEDPHRAAAMLGRAAQLRARYDRPETEAERAVAASAALAARRALGDAAYEEAARAGAELGIGRGLG